MIHRVICVLACLWPLTSPVSSAAILTRQLDPDLSPGYVSEDVAGDENGLNELEGNELILSEMRRLGVDLKNRDAASLLADLSNADDGSGPTEQDLLAEKRAFSPWGGKRVFSPWAGKRAFSPWAGKRAFSPWAGKRAFNPWGGKRAFSPWSGKRGTGEEEEKRSFSPWAGKRAFNPWAGKRSYHSEDKGRDAKRQFTPWGGKRGSFNPWAGKRSDEGMEDDKRAFSPWGGKRAESTTD